MTTRERRELERKNAVMVHGVCPWCGEEPAPKWGHPCATCVAEFAREKLEEQAARHILTLHNRYSRQAGRY